VSDQDDKVLAGVPVSPGASNAYDLAEELGLEVGEVERSLRRLKARGLIAFRTYPAEDDVWFKTSAPPSGTFAGRDLLPYSSQGEMLQAYADAGHQVSVRKDRNGSRRVRLNGARTEINLHDAMVRVEKWMDAGRPRAAEGTTDVTTTTITKPLAGPPKRNTDTADRAAEERRALKRAKAGLPPAPKPAEPEPAPTPAKAGPARKGKAAPKASPAPAEVADLGLGPDPAPTPSKAKPSKAKPAPASKGASAAAQWKDPAKRARLMAGFVAKKAFPNDEPLSAARKAQVDIIAEAIQKTSVEAVKEKVGNTQPRDLAALRKLLG
jgi:hypothetical protein